MSRKDYELIAEAFALFNYLHQPTRHFIANAIADRLEKDNHRFDRKRFLSACDLITAYNPTKLEAVGRAGSLATIESVPVICHT